MTPSLSGALVADALREVQRQEALLEKGALQRAIFNSANFSSIATDARGVIQIFNVGAERMLGYTAAEVMNRITPADISDPQELIVRAAALSAELGTPITPGFEALVFKASRGIEDIYELTYIRRDGSRFPAVVSVTALRDADGAVIGYLLIGTDNTARKQIEAEQQQLDQRLRDQQFYTRSLIESNTDAIVTTDPAGFITDVNRQMETLTGCTRDELIGAPFKSFFTDPARAEAGIRRVLVDKRITDYELTAHARDGAETAVSYNAATYYDRDRRLQGVFAAARDVTERRRLDRALHETNVALEGAKRVAEAANRAKSAFLAAMSHEIRTPMNGVVGMVELLEQGELQPAQREIVRIARESADALLGIIDDVLDFSKIEAGHFQVDCEPLDVAAVVTGVCDTLAQVAAKKGVALSCDIDPTLPPRLGGDAARLRQVLINLAGNAIKFSSGQVVPGRVAVRATWVESGPPTAALQFTVTDNGIGMAPDTLLRLFAPFTQGDASTTRRYGGTGLGLSISYGLAQLMGGALEVQSELGHGATFTLRLPLAVLPDVLPDALPVAVGGAVGGAGADAAAADGVHAAPSRPGPAADVPHGQVPHGLILVAEDNEINQMVLQRQLALLGYGVRMAGHGLEALALWREGDYALLLTDLHMPHMDGYELATAIRHGEAGARRMPIVALTANALRSDHKRCLDLGMDDCLTKPLQLVDLKAMLDRWLPGVAAPPGASPAAAPPEPALAPEPLPPADLRVLAALVGDDPPVLADMVQAFRRSAERSRLEMARALDAAAVPAAVLTDAGRPIQPLADAAHRLKSGARSIGALALGALCADLEAAAEAGHTADCAALLPRLLAELAAVYRHLDAAPGHIAAPGPA